MGATAQQVPSKTESEVVNGAVSFVDVLDKGERLTGTPTIDAVTDLTFANILVSTVILIINNNSVPAGMAVQFSVSGGLAATGTYTIPVVCGTDSIPAQTRRGKLTLTVESDS